MANKNDFPHKEELMKNFKDEFVDTFVEKLEDSKKMHTAIERIINETIKNRIRGIMATAMIALLVALSSFITFISKVYIEKQIEQNITTTNSVQNKKS
ncbi:MAG: hypothetical protein RL208_750 [Pseudomonadota bacterium]|jgi:amino acid permease